jgi:lipoprotein-anchoring transpeptidase ErfK/SrfK
MAVRTKAIIATRRMPVADARERGSCMERPRRRCSTSKLRPDQHQRLLGKTIRASPVRLVASRTTWQHCRPKCGLKLTQTRGCHRSSVAPSLITKEPAGTIIIDTPNTYLYLVLGSGKALRYGVGVGREGFTWSGVQQVTRMAEWPDWNPPEEMIVRQPYLPRFMAGGETNPLGARALYLGQTVYRIHGTNQPSTIGTFVSSGCIRLTNEDVMDLYSRVKVGTRVVVLPGRPPATTAATSLPPGAGSIQSLAVTTR